MTTTLGSIGQIHVTVADVPGAVAFFRDVLGLPLLFEVPSQSMAFFDCGGTRLYLGPAEGGGPASRPLLYFRVDDIERAYRDLDGRGARFRSPPHVAHRDAGVELAIAFLEAPDGLPVALMQERPTDTGA
jgi:catechol 2,3-dioxygenase-like lactoylglutathione lyase family enzyme